ncbi:MAG: catalase family peroxidase [Acidobacteriota bacterium]
MTLRHTPVQWRTGRWHLIAVVLIAVLSAIPARPQNLAPASTAGARTPQDLVDALHAAFGEHHARAVHAKGLLLDGTFTPSKDARALSRAPIFTSATLPVIVRFSDFTGIPDIPDTAGEANPRGFAVKIRAASGDVDIVTHSFNGFPVATSDEFAVFLRAIGASGAGVAHPTPIEVFLDRHPVAKHFVASQKPPPASYATAAYFGVNSFKFTSASGRAAYVRYRFVPRAGEHYLSAAELEGKGPNYLLDELPRRLAKEAIVFDWFAQISEAGDKVEDPSIAWPEERRLVPLGTITITRVTRTTDADRTTLFLPGTSHPGIEPADQMLTLRDDAYPISFKARQ